MKLNLTLTIFFCLIISNVGNTASFDCKTAKTNIEELICQNSEISQLDENLSKLYNEIKIKAKKPKLLIRNQFEWLKKRDQCLDKICLNDEYKSREEFLTKWPEYEANLIPTFKDLPSGSSMKEEYFLEDKLSKYQLQLQEKHDKLIELLISLNIKNSYPSLISALKDQQNSWNKFILDECNLVGIFIGAGGSWPLNYMMKCEINLIKDRLLKIESVIDCIKKTPSKESWSYTSKCLPRLNVLAK